jgi:beta-N-acetylhexosaminidase
VRPPSEGTPGGLPQPEPPAEGAASAAAGEAPGYAESPPGSPLMQPPRLPLGPDELIETMIASLTLRQKIGQRFITGFPGTRMGERARRLVREGYVGGVLLSRQNVDSSAQVRRLTEELQKTAAANNPPIGLLVAVDQEGGRVTRLELPDVTRFPAPFYWGRLSDPQYVEAAAYITSRELLSLGCNLNLAPVLDLYGAADASVVGDRSMGSNPVQVGEWGVYYLRGARRAGMAAAVKHFPGHGRSTTDSHRSLPVVDAEERELINTDLIPFQMVIADGAEVVMTAHILYPRLDPEYPATLSRKILQGLLRDRLGFKGVILSDDIEMGALAGRYSPRQILSLSLNAGVDLIVAFGALDVLQLIEEVYRMAQAGEIDPTLIDEGLRRVLRLKLRYGLLVESPAPGS